MSDAPDGLTVAGRGSVTAPPDHAILRLGVETVGGTAQEAMDANSRDMRALVDAVKALGVAGQDLQTSSIVLWPHYAERRRADKPQITGYTAKNTVTVRVRDLAIAGSLVDAAVRAGANADSGVAFGIEDDAALRRQALAAATRDAREKAEAIAAAAGVRITGIKAIAEGAAEHGFERPALYAASMREAAAPPPVEPGELTITATVRIAYTYE
jgi:uncharacterized protein YggE